MAFLLRAKNLLLAGLSSVLLLVAMQETAHAEPVLASYYAAELAGNPTASGEPFAPYDMTAAHPYLPFGTLLTVSNAGRSVTVRVNDRGPHVAGRGLDLSLGAAQAIGITAAGTAVVETDAAEAPEARPSVSNSETAESDGPSRIASSAKTIPSAETQATGERPKFVTVGMLTPPGKRMLASMDGGSSPWVRRAGAHHGTTSSPEAAIATKLTEGEQMAQTLAVRSASLWRRRG
jgi:peptidoglycan lytic transglycosylase